MLNNHGLHNQINKNMKKKRSDKKFKTKLYLLGTLLFFVMIGYLFIINIKCIQDTFEESLLPYKANKIHHTNMDNKRQLTDSLYPPDGLTPEQQRKTGGVLHLLGMLYMFVAIAIVCDEYFVPAIEVIVERLEMQEDTAGATWMAAGGSAPELFTSILGTFVAKSQVGFGTIVGSAVFNVLFVVGCCALATQPKNIPLTYWPFARDSMYYALCLCILSIFFGAAPSANQIYWWEALILLFLYVIYVSFMPFNERVFMWFERTILKRKEEDIVDELRQGVLQKSTVNFHVKLFTYLTKDKTFNELAEMHIVQAIKGTLKETFDIIDENKNGTIDKEEFKLALRRIQGVEPQKCDELFNQVDKDQNGFIDFEEFQSWYLSSETKLQNDIRNIFRKFDRNRDNTVYTSSIKELLTLLNDNEEPTDDEIEDARKHLDKTKDGRIEENEFMKWYLSTDFYEKMRLKRQSSVAIFSKKSAGETNGKTNSLSEFPNDPADVNNEGTYEEEDDDEGIDISFPKGWVPRMFYIFVFPIMICLYVTMWDMQKKKNQKWWPWTFAVSILWLGVFSFFMVWWVEIVAHVWGVPDEVLGLTFLAAGTSVPDLFSSVAVAKKGEGDMALSSSIGSNIFDILIGLPLPWFVYSVSIGDGFIPVQADTLLISVLILIGMLLCVLIAIKCAGWTLTKYLGYSMFVLYFLFLGQDILRWRLRLGQN